VRCIQLTVQQVSKNDCYHSVVYSKQSETETSTMFCFVILLLRKQILF